MYKNALCVALLSSMPLAAHAYSIESMTITGGTLDVIDAYGITTFADLILTPGPAAAVDDGLPNGVIDADGVHGSAASPVVSTLLLDTPVLGYFAHSQTTCGPDCSSMITLLDPDPDAVSMTGTPWDPMISADFSGFFIDFNGNKMLQGGTATGTGSWIVIPTAEGAPGVFSFALSWSAPVLVGPFQGFTGNWTVTGTAVTAVPEAETYAMMLAGLALVGFAASHRRESPAEKQKSGRSDL